MDNSEKSEAFYKRLKEQLTLDTLWPAPYMYKFIVSNQFERVAEIRAIFDGTNAMIQTRDSSKGTYISVSITVNMESPEAVIEKYLEVSKVEGVISL